MLRRDLVNKLLSAGFQGKGGTKHEKFIKNGITVMVPRHREIPEPTVKKILREAGLK